MLRSLLLTLLFLLPTTHLIAQQAERAGSVHQVDLIIRANVGSETPFWLQHNRRDLIPETSGVQAGLLAEGERPLSDRINLQWGGEVYGSGDATIRDRPLHQAYLGLQYRNWQLRGGLWAETVGITDPDLSAGPSIWSQNARPMPKIKIELTDFTSVPLTDGWMQVMGGFSHGWFEGGRVVEDFYLHEKYAYAKIGKSGYPELYAGLIHMGQWGGYDTRRFGQLPVGFRDFLRIFMGEEGGESSPQTWQNNRFGNSLGSWQAGIYLQRGQWEFLVNKETIFEDGSGLKLWSPEDGVQGINIRYHHGAEASGTYRAGSTGATRTLLPAASSTSRHLAVSGFTYEFWHTKSQSGPGRQNRPSDWEGDPLYDEDGHRFGGRDNYFNHAVYRQGWSYYGRTIGVPFITHDIESGRMINNRMIGHHLGLMHQAGRWGVRALYSWTKNYGAYDFPNNTEGPFDEPLTQNYTMLSVYTDLDRLVDLPLTAALEAGLDWGEFKGRRTGVLLSLVYRLAGAG